MSFLFSFLLVGFVFLCTELIAAEKEAEVPTRTVEFFDAIDEGLIEVKIITDSSLDARFVIKNQSRESLKVNKPFAYAAVPVHAQIDDFFGPGGGMDMMDGGGRRGGGGMGMGMGGGGGSGGGRNQSSGGGFSGGGGSSSSWSIAPEKIVREKVKTVCLEHGKDEPRSSHKYEVKPIDSVARNSEVAVLCNLVGTGRVDQSAAQAAVWHLNNNMSWEELAAKTYKPIGKRETSYFSDQQMAIAQASVGKAREFIKESGFDIKKASKSITSEGNGDKSKAGRGFVGPEKIGDLLKKNSENELEEIE